MAARDDPRPLYNAPALPAGVSIDADGTIIISDDSDFNPERDGADADIGPPLPPAPDPMRPGFHPDRRDRVNSYATRLPGDWTKVRGQPHISQWRARARDVYWARVPANLVPDTLWNMNRLPEAGYKMLTPDLRDDIKVIGSAAMDRRIANMDPLITTARPNIHLLKSDMQYFLKTTGIVEYRMMDALFAAVACIPDVRGPPGYDYGSPQQADTVALPAITWDNIYQKFRSLEGEGVPPSSLPPYLQDPIDPSTDQPGDPTNLHPEVKSAYAILLPILLDGELWMFAYIHFGRKTILVVDPDYNGKGSAERCRKVEKYLHYWNIQNLSGNPHRYPNGWHTMRVRGVLLENSPVAQGSGLAAVLGALLTVCDVGPEWDISTPQVDLRAFFAAVLSAGGFRGVGLASRTGYRRRKRRGLIGW